MTDHKQIVSYLTDAFKRVGFKGVKVDIQGGTGLM